MILRSVTRVGWLTASYSTTTSRELVAALTECAKARDLKGGKRIHKEAAAAGFHTDIYLAAALITMYRKCGSMKDAQEVFERLVHRDVVLWNSLLLGYAEHGQASQALRLFWSMDCEQDDATFVSALKACTRLEEGLAVHARAREVGLDSKVTVLNGLMDMYSGCGENRRALDVFESMTERNHVSFVFALKACAALAAKDETSQEFCLAKGLAIHSIAKTHGFHKNLFVANALVDMYSKCRCMAYAREAFVSMATKDVVTWTSLMLGYVDNGQPVEALKHYTSINCQPNHVTFIAALKACGKMVGEQFCLEKTEHIHRQVRQSGYETHICVANSLLDTYSRCSSMSHAKALFEKMERRDVVTWNSLILGYVENGEYTTALDVFADMQVRPDSVTFLAVLKACSGLASEKEGVFCLERGVSIHKQLRNGGFESNLLVTTALLEMYTKCNGMLHAKAVFDQMPNRNVVSWNCLMLGYVENGESIVALELFEEMDCRPNHVSFVAVLKACGALASQGRFDRAFLLEKGRLIHKRAKECELHNNMFVSNTLIDMYAKCGSMASARETFDETIHKDVVSWNCIILGYVDNDESSAALSLFDTMAVEPNYLTFIAAIRACVSLASGRSSSEKELCLRRGVDIHSLVKHRGLESNIVVSNTLLDMYSKCGSMEHANAVFQGISRPNTVSWNCLILGYVDNGDSRTAMELFRRMDCQPNEFTFLAALKAASGLHDSEKKSCLRDVMSIHEQAKELGYSPNLAVATTLLDVYCKCSSMRNAQAVFDSMSKPDVVSWTSLILGYVEDGQSPRAIELFLRMDCRPDAPCFIAVLRACSNVGALELGRYFHAWICKMGLESNEMLETCLVDFYAKCSCMNTAEQVFDGIRGSGNTFSWTALIAGYTMLGNTQRVFRLAVEMLEARLELDEITMVCILSACSHAGMVDDGRRCFSSMIHKHGISPVVEHYNCMTDMLGRADRLGEALQLVEKMPCKANSITWTSLLAACGKWKNLEVGRVAFDALVAGDSNHGAAYVLMSKLYESHR